MPILSEPTWQPNLALLQKAFDDPSALCNIRFTPSIVTGILLRILQAHFADANNIRDPALKELTWAADDPAGAGIQSKILIIPLHQYDPRQLQQRPALLVLRQAAETHRLPMDSRTLPSLDTKGFFRGDRHLVPITCTHVVRCLAAGAFAADRLGEEVFYRLLEYFPVIKADFPFSDFDVKILNPPQKVDEHSENFAVDVGLPWTHIHGWTLTAEAPILREIKLQDRTFRSTEYQGQP